MRAISPLYFLLLALQVGGIALLAARGLRRARTRPLRAALWLLGAAVGGGFSVLTAVSLRLPPSRGSQFRLEHELVRFGALGCGVAFLVFVLAALLPSALDLLERRGFVPFVGARHVRATKSGFLTVISVLSMAGVGLSSCALSSVTSVMGGFGADLKRKILGNNAHITIDTGKTGGFSDWEQPLDRVRLAPGVAAATPVVAGEAMASSASNTAGALVRGVDPYSIGTVIDLPGNIEIGKLEYLIEPRRLSELPADEVIGRGPDGEAYLKGPDLRGFGPLDPAVAEATRPEAKVYPGLIIGRELAKSLHVLVGEEVTLLSPMGELGPMGVMPKSRRFRVAAIFYSGMYEYDATHAYMLLPEAQRFFELPERITHIDVRADEAERAPELRGAVEGALARDDLRVRDWKEMNRNLFSALKLEKLATFIILCLAILVASFCIICTLLLMVTEKGKEIAILKALGSSDAAVRRIFMVEGMIIGAIGTVFGVGTGLAACLGLKWYGVRLNPDVYYIDKLPVNVNASDYVAVAVAAFLICTLATVYPAAAASRLPPVDGLRYE